MREVFLEETAEISDFRSAKIKYNIFFICSILFYAIGVIYLVVTFLSLKVDPLTGNAFLNVLLILLPALICFVAGFLFGIFKGKFYTEYDYTFVSGSMRINAVINKSSNKLLYCFDTNQIEKIGNYDSEEYKRLYLMPDIKKVKLTPNKTPSENKNFYYAFVSKVGGKKYLFTFELSNNFIKTLLQFINLTSIDRGIRK